MDLFHLVVAMLLTFGAAYLMLAAGFGKNALEWKRVTRACPSCGRDLRDCRCS